MRNSIHGSKPDIAIADLSAVCGGAARGLFGGLSKIDVANVRSGWQEAAQKNMTHAQGRVVANAWRAAGQIYGLKIPSGL